MRGGESRRIVQPVADHQHAPALRRQRGQARGLAGGRDLGLPFADARGDRRAGDGARPVARQQLDGEAAALQMVDRRRCVGPQPVGESKARRQAAGRGEPELGQAIVAGIGDAAEASPNRDGRRRPAGPGRDARPRPRPARRCRRRGPAPAPADGACSLPGQRLPLVSQRRDRRRPAQAGRASGCRSCRARHGRCARCAPAPSARAAARRGAAAACWPRPGPPAPPAPGRRDR